MSDAQLEAIAEGNSGNWLDFDWAGIEPEVARRCANWGYAAYETYEPTQICMSRSYGICVHWQYRRNYQCTESGQ